MTDHDGLLERVGHADPYPEHVVLREELVDARRSLSEIMSDAASSFDDDSVIELSGRGADVRRRRRAFTLIAAAIAIAAVSVALLVRVGGDPESVEVVPADTAPSSIPVTTSPSATVTTPPGPTRLFTDLPPDSTVALPPGPIDVLAGPGGIWTGTELIVWGEPSAPDESPPPEGAAFDAETGTWRVVAPAPVDGGSVVVGAGSEMVVWGGQGGAAYDPDADTWRRLPDDPITARDVATAVWTGNQLVLLANREFGTSVEAAAYDPARDEWRALAETDCCLASGAVSTGTTVLTILDSSDVLGSAEDYGRGRQLARYDLSTDTWHIDADANYVSLVGVPDADGVTRTVLAMPVEPGAPLDLLDAAGNPIASLPAHPRDITCNGCTTAATGIWLGDEAVFSIMAAPTLIVHPQAWALDPATGTWRSLPDHIAAAVEGLDGVAVAAGDVLFTSDGAGGIAYRAPTHGDRE